MLRVLDIKHIKVTFLFLLPGISFMIVSHFQDVKAKTAIAKIVKISLERFLWNLLSWFRD